MQKSLKGFNRKEAIFVDANIFLHHAFNANNASIEFLKQIESYNIKAYTSALVIEEVVFKLLIQAASNYLDITTIEKVKRLLMDNKNKENVFKPVIEYREYIDILKDFGLIILDLTDKDMIASLQKAKTYGLITADAVHIAVMERKGITNIASSDSDFEKVDCVTLWKP